jgi:hypothetical protein
LISFNRDIDPESAKTVTTPINTNGNFSANLYMGYGIKLKKLDMYVNVSPSANFNRSVNSINGQINNSNNLNSNFSCIVISLQEQQPERQLSQ